ncbi:hypothetical protein [Furfurilactobacillus siliginis]|nr:hypothetical protein [Furfurilactobacillus siliginis]
MKTHRLWWYLVRGTFHSGAVKGAGWLLTNPSARATEYYMTQLKLTKHDVEKLTHIPALVIPDVNDGTIVNVNGAYLNQDEWNYLAETLAAVALQHGIKPYDDTQYVAGSTKSSDIAHF